MRLGEKKYSVASDIFNMLRQIDIDLDNQDITFHSVNPLPLTEATALFEIPCKFAQPKA